MADKKNEWDALRDEVHSSDGVLTVQAWRLRDALGAGRLTERINGQISDALAQRGLGHVPREAVDLPTSQYDPVRIYDRTSTIGKVIEAAHNPTDETDEYLREAIDDRAVRILEQVRVLVAD